MIHYQLTEGEVIRGLVQNRPRRRRVIISIVLILIGAPEMVLGTQLRSPLGELCSIFGFALVAFGILAILLRPLAYRRAFTRIIRANPVFTAPKEVSFDERGIVLSSPTQRSELIWEHFKKLTQNEGYLYLHHDELGSVTLLPKRAFDEAKLREFLHCSQAVPRA